MMITLREAQLCLPQDVDNRISLNRIDVLYLLKLPHIYLKYDKVQSLI
jgi:hypothetical protein